MHGRLMRFFLFPKVNAMVNNFDYKNMFTAKRKPDRNKKKIK